MATLIVSRGVSGSVSDASGIQQQGAYILRTIGQQLRQNGSLYLNPDPAGVASTDVLSAVVFEIKHCYAISTERKVMHPLVQRILKKSA